MSARPPAALNERSRFIAWMLLQGHTQREIAHELELTEAWVSTVIHSPLFQALLREMRDKVANATVEDIRGMILAQGKRSLDVMVQLRDAGENDGVRFNAAKDLMDRHPQMARIQKLEEERSIRITLDAGTIQRMAQTQRELEAVPVAGKTIPSQIRARTIEEALTDPNA